jgi:hypothetical protein
LPPPEPSLIRFNAIPDWAGTCRCEVKEGILSRPSESLLSVLVEGRNKEALVVKVRCRFDGPLKKELSESSASATCSALIGGRRVGTCPIGVIASSLDRSGPRRTLAFPAARRLAAILSDAC